MGGLLPTPGGAVDPMALVGNLVGALMNQNMAPVKMIVIRRGHIIISVVIIFLPFCIGEGGGGGYLRVFTTHWN